MPVVPRLSPDPVPTAPLPGVRVPTDIPSGAFGSPQNADLSGFQRQITDIVQRERDKADSVALLDADNKLATAQTDLHTQAVQLRGKDALGATQLIAQGWQKSVADITKGLNTDQQREAFTRRVGARWNTLYEAVETHAANETQQYVEQTAGDALKNRLTHAVEFYQQPGAIAQSVDETKAILADTAKHQGWSAETLADKTQTAVTGIHASVIDRMVANHQDLDAAAYLTAHRDEMTGSQLIQAEQLVSRGSILGAGQRAADSILQSSPSLSGALAEAGKILDPQVREQTEERVRRGFEDRALAQRESQLQNEIQAGAIVRKTKSFDAVPPKLLDGMTPIQIRDLKLLEESLRRRPSDLSVLMPLRNMAGLQPEQFKTLDLGQYKDQLSDSDLRSLQSQQRTLRLAGQRAEASTRAKQGKELTKLQSEAGFYKSQQLAIPDLLSRHIKALQDSLRTGKPAPSSGVVPGAPLTPAAPAASSTRPPDDQPDASAETASIDVPTSWIDHARGNPDYAQYLATMGVPV